MRKLVILSLVFALPLFILIPAIIVQGLFGVDLLEETQLQWSFLGPLLSYLESALLSFFPYSNYTNFLALLSIFLFVIYFPLAFFSRNNAFGRYISLGLLMAVYAIMIFVLFSYREELQLRQRALDEDWERLKPQASSFVCYDDRQNGKRLYFDVYEVPGGEGKVDVAGKHAENSYFGIGTIAKMYEKKIVLYEYNTLGKTLDDQINFLKTCKNAEGKSIPDLYEIDDQFVGPSI